MFSRFPNHIDGFSPAFSITFGTRGDDTITFTGPGIVATGSGDDTITLKGPGIVAAGSGNDMIVASAGPNLILTGHGPDDDCVLTDGGFARVFAQGDLTVMSTGGITRVTLSEGAVGTTVVEAEDHDGGMTPPDIIIWDIAGDGEGFGQVWPTEWKLTTFDSPGTDVSMQDSLDDVTYTLKDDGSGGVLALGNDALVVINDLARPSSLDEMIRSGELVLRAEAVGGITIAGSEARDIIEVGDDIKDVFIFVEDTDPAAYPPPQLDDAYITSFSINADASSDALDLTAFTSVEILDALDNQVRTEVGAVVTLGDTTITLFAGEAFIVTEDVFLL